MTRTIFIAAGLALAVTLPSVSAQAQAARTFVSAAGNDSNPCSIVAPCRHFQAAVNSTAVGGEVDALDPAGYSPFTINQAITIEGQGWSYIAPPANGAAITINAVSGNVVIHGVSLNGDGVTGATNGIVFNSGGTLTVRDSVIRNFTGIGINFVPTASGLTQLFVSNTIVSDNGTHGIAIAPSGAATANSVLDHVQIEHNGIAGLLISTAVATNVTISDCVSSNNGQAGIGEGMLVDGLHAYLAVRRCNISNNYTGVEADDSAIIRLSQSQITGNQIGWTTNNSGSVGSTFDNLIDNNPNGNGGPSTLAYK